MVRANMLRMKALAWLSFAALSAASGSTCHGSSNEGGEAAKEPADQVADVTFPGVDTSMLTTRERHEYSTYVSELLSPCSNVPVSITQCIKENRACTKCVPAAKFVLKGEREGLSRDQIEKAYHSRFDSDKVKNVPVDGAAYKGPDAAPVVLVEFADFTCPHCGIMAPRLEELFQTHKDQIRYVYRYFPLTGPGHENGQAAAQAAAAADLQGKFWPLHDAMFANQQHLAPSDIDQMAKAVGIDLNKFHVDMESQAIKDKVAADKKLGESLGVEGTPTIFINGREFAGDLNDWVNMELGSSGTTVTVPAAGAAAADAGSAASLSAKTPATPAASAAVNTNAKK